MSVHYCPFQNGSLPSPKHAPLRRQSACSQEQATSRKCTQGNKRSLPPPLSKSSPVGILHRAVQEGAGEEGGGGRREGGNAAFPISSRGGKAWGEVAEEPVADLFHPGKCSSGRSNARRAGEETTAGRGKTKRVQEAGEEGWPKPTG